jgi:hypothetical protein
MKAIPGTTPLPIPSDCPCLSIAGCATVRDWGRGVRPRWRALETIEEANGVTLLDWSILCAAAAGCVAHSFVEQPA